MLNAVIVKCIMHKAQLYIAAEWPITASTQGGAVRQLLQWIVCPVLSLLKHALCCIIANSTRSENMQCPEDTSQADWVLSA